MVGYQRGCLQRGGQGPGGPIRDGEATRAFSISTHRAPAPQAWRAGGAGVASREPGGDQCRPPLSPPVLSSWGSLWDPPGAPGRPEKGRRAETNREFPAQLPKRMLKRGLLKKIKCWLLSESLTGYGDHLSLRSRHTPCECIWPYTHLRNGRNPSWSPVLTCACVLLSCFSHVWLCATPWTVACQAPLSMGLSR